MTTTGDDQDADELKQLVLRRIARMGAHVTGVTVGVLAGSVLFIATNWLLLRGGEHVGQHLSLLSQFFIGYRVSFVGSLIGFVWGLATGYVAGFALASVYNWVVDRRNRSREQP